MDLWRDFWQLVGLPVQVLSYLMQAVCLPLIVVALFRLRK